MAELTIVPSRERFAELAEQGNVIPVFVDFVADGETPASAYQKLDEGGHSFLFESAEQSEQSGRYSFLGFDPRLIVRGETGEDPLAALEKVMAGFRFVAQPELPRFAGGAVGFLGYDVARYFEPARPEPPEDDLQLPEMIFMIMGLLVVFDHRYRRVKIVANAFLDDYANPAAAYESAEKKIRSALAKLSGAARLPLIDAQKAVSAKPVRSNLTQANFEAAVLKAKEH